MRPETNFDCILFISIIKAEQCALFLKTMASHKLSFYVLLLLVVFFIVVDVVAVPEKVFITLTFFMTILNILLVMSCLSHFSMIYFIDGHVRFMWVDF